MKAARRVLSALAAPTAVLALTALAGCTAVADSASDTSTVGTVGGVGELPPTVSATDTAAPVTETASSTPETDVSSSTSTIPVTETIGAKAAGNRLLMIGDSLTASISHRYGDEACQALVPLGWRVEVDAETGRFIDFGKKVLDKRLNAGWDAAVVFLGNNYGKDKAVYQAALHAILLRLVPRPTVLITTAMFRPEQAEVNEAIMEEAAQFTSVTVLDWATLGTDPSLTGGDNLHLTDAGRRALGYYLAATMGAAPAQPGECLKTSFTDDSAGSPNGPAGNATATKSTTKTTTKPSNSTGTTVKASTSTTTTVKSGGTTPTTTPTGSSTATTPSTQSTPAPTPTPIVTLPPVTTAPPSTASPTTPAPSTSDPGKTITTG